MLILFKNIKQKNILIFDAEYNEGDLIQFAGLLFRQVQKDIYQIKKSINFYVKLDTNKRINYFIEKFTGITDSFLEEFGITIEEAWLEIDKLLEDVDDLLVVSHGLYNDRLTLDNNGINLFEKEEIDITGYCTYKAAKRILNKEKDLKLGDVANEAGLFISEGHNAFDDTWATVAVFSLLCKLEEENKSEKILQSIRY